MRGFAIICMVFYHAMYDLTAIYGMTIPFFATAWFGAVRTVFAGAFVFISGTACRYSRNNLKRGALCFGAGMAITYATALFAPEQTVRFGVLHMLGVAMLIFGLAERWLDKIKPMAGILVFAALYIFTCDVMRGAVGIPGLLKIPLPGVLYESGELYALGFIGWDFTSSDFFPLFPWLFLFLAGSFFGVLLKVEKLPRWFYSIHSRPLAFVGRHTMAVYLAHQPALMLLFGLLL